VQRGQEFAVDVVLGLSPGAVADPDRARPAPAAQVGQGPFGQVVLAPDPVHDLQRTFLWAWPPAALVMKETKSSASSEQAPMWSASIVRLASRIQA
jgi:hypothetical protein